MEQLDKIYGAIADTLHELVSVWFSPYSNLYWLYLASALVIAVLLYLLRDARPGRRAIADVVRACLPQSIYATRSFRHDVGMCFSNILLHSLFFGSLIVSTVWVEEQTWRLLHGLFGPIEHLRDGLGAKVLLTILLMLAVDLGFFLSHYLQHKTPVLWKFHKVHHSAQALNPFTTFRRHPVDLMIDGNITGLLVGAVLGMFDYVSFGGLEMIAIAGVNAGIFLFLLTTAHLQHSHVWLSYGNVLNRLIVSPAMHQIHHSRDPRHLDKNFGNMFSFWDALTGTRYLPHAREALQYGLAGDEETYEHWWQLYTRPFIEIGGMLTMKMNESVSIAMLLAMSVGLFLTGASSSLAADAGNVGQKVAPKQDAASVVAPMFTP